jgi:aspartate/glutamate racemase
MEIKLIEGCTDVSLLIDNKDVSTITTSQLKRIIKKTINNILESEDNNLYEKCQDLLIEIIQKFCDNVECSEQPCPQCGDWTYTYIIDIKDK